MAPNRITRSGAKRRALLVAAATLAVVAALAGCGGGAASSTAPAASAPGNTGTAADVSVPTPAAQSADGALLDKVLARQEAAVDAYAKLIPALPPRRARMAAYFRAQEQEHVDAVLKAMRGLGATVEPTAESIEPGELKSDRERLVFLYEVESATIDEELSAISNLEATWPRSLLASTVADQAQHLVLLRRALGAGPLAQIPGPFEDGTAPPPE